MTQKQKPAKPPSDPYAQRGKTLTSSVQRLRGWVGTDPARAPELADALVELTAHRLLGHGYAVAAADAQESVRRAAELLTAPGPIGPYTSVVDAGRYVTAVVHLATLQAGIGQPEAAGRTLESLHTLHTQLGELGVELDLDPTTSVWALGCSARAALASGDVATANSCADAAAARLATPPQGEDPDRTQLAVDVDRLVADCRWAAGRPADSVALLHQAQVRYETWVDGRLATPGRLSPALLDRLAEPLFGLYRDLADRLVATGETDTGLDRRRALVDLLRTLAPRIGDRARSQLASSLADLACDLAAAGRLAEAEDVGTEAGELVKDWPPTTPARWLVAAARGRVSIDAGHPGEAVATLRRLADTVPDGSGSAAQAVGLRTLAEALRKSGDPAAADAAQRTYDELAAEVAPAGSGDATLVDLARGVVSRGEQPVSWSPLSPDHPYATAVAATAPAEPWRQDGDAWLSTERAEAHRREVERHEQARREAERAAAEQQAAERAAAEQQAADRARAEEEQAREAERRAAAEEAERVERKRRREERLDEHRRETLRRDIDRLSADLAAGDPTAEQELEERRAELAELERPAATPAVIEPQPPAPDEPLLRPEPRPEPEPHPGPESESQPEPEPQPAAELPTSPEKTEPDELELAERAWSDARARGDRRAARGANEQVVELLRLRAQADPAAYAGRLQEALEALASARLRGGDVFGSRSAAREARAIGRQRER